MFKPRYGVLGAAPAGRAAGGRDRGEAAGGELEVKRGRVVEESERGVWAIWYGVWYGG